MYEKLSVLLVSLQLKPQRLQLRLGEKELSPNDSREDGTDESEVEC
jgi:hypothetical protein